MRRVLLTLALLAAAAAGRASAAPVIYLESMSGDLPQIGFPLPILAFDVGTNIVSGRFGRDAADNSDLDSFAFTILAGAVLVSGGVTLTDAQGDITSSTWRFGRGSANSTQGTLLEPLTSSSPGSAALTTVPQGPGTYNMTHITFGQVDPAPNTSDYTFTFEVRSTAAVPAPAGLVLALAGVPLLGLVRRRAA